MMLSPRVALTKNKVDLRYIPEYTDLLQHIRVYKRLALI